MSRSAGRLFCSEGDVVAFKLDVNAVEPPIRSGDLYRAAELVEWGWNLELVSGNGPAVIRLLNSEMERYVEKIQSIEQ